MIVPPRRGRDTYFHNAKCLLRCFPTLAVFLCSLTYTLINKPTEKGMQCRVNREACRYHGQFWKKGALGDIESRGIEYLYCVEEGAVDPTTPLQPYSSRLCEEVSLS